MVGWRPRIGGHHGIQRTKEANHGWNETPTALRSAGRTKIRNTIKKRSPRIAAKITDEIWAALDAQTLVLPAEETWGRVVGELLADLERIQTQRIRLAAQIEEASRVRSSIEAATTDSQRDRNTPRDRHMNRLGGEQYRAGQQPSKALTGRPRLPELLGVMVASACHDQAPTQDRSAVPRLRRLGGRQSALRGPCANNCGMTQKRCVIRRPPSSGMLRTA